MTNIPQNVINKQIYIKAREKIKKRVKVWPSAYASGQLVIEYKKMGGKYKGLKKGNLDRWFQEKWVDLSRPKKGGGYHSCGRDKSSVRNYPYCRPSIRVNSKTPMTVDELITKYGKEKIKKLVAKKQKFPKEKNFF